MIDGSDVLLLPRPRRFGKTLNLSMLRYFFERTEAEDRRKLFEGLAIERDAEAMTHFGRYPTVFLTLKNVKGKTWEAALTMLRMLLGNLFRRHTPMFEHLAPAIRRRVLAAIALGLVVATPGRAGSFREIRHLRVGFIGPGAAGVPPETSPCPSFGYAGSVGFPYRNRSLVVDLGVPAPAVHRIVLVDDYSDNGGDSLTVRKYGLQIYTSDDNRTFTPYAGKFQTRIRDGKPEDGFDAVVLDGLNIRARYIKLYADLPDDHWDFGCHDLRRMVRVFQDPERVADILGVAADRYVAGDFPVRVRVHLPRAGTVGFTLRLSLTKRGAAAVAVATRIPIPQEGARDRVIEAILPLAGIAFGPKSLNVTLENVAGRILARASVSTFVCSSVTVRRAEDGPVAAPHPGAVVILNDLERYAGKQSGGPGNPWKSVTAECTGGSSRIRLLVGRGNAKPVRIPLPVKGWHAVAIGLVGGDSRVRAALLPDGKGRLCRLETWSDRRPGAVLGEAFIDCRNLDGSILEVAPVQGAPVRIAFVRLLALSGSEIAMVKAARHARSVPRVIIHSDGFSGFFSGAYTTKETLQKVIDRYAGTPIYSFDWCVGPSSTFTYNTRVGTIFGTNVEKFWRRGDRQAAESLRRLIAAGNDPLRIVVEQAHKRGIRINATLRMNANYGGEPAKVFNGEFYWRHLNLRIVNKKGKPQPHLSYAYPEVRAFRLAIVREAAGYGVNGIHLNFLRHPPFFGYDPPLTAAFRERYGVEPDAIPGDERWYRLRADVMTRFVRRIRAALDEIGKRAGRRIALSATVEYKNNLKQGLDVERWIKEGLLDVVSPGVHGLGGTYFPVKRFAAMTHGTRCKLFPMLECTIRGHDPTPASERGEVVYESEYMTLNRFRRRFLELFREGADGVYPFNGGDPTLVRTLSRVESLFAWERLEEPLVAWFSEVRLPKSTVLNRHKPGKNR